MKLTLTSTATALILATTALSAPTDIKYDAPPGGWESIDYPAGTGENLPYYPPATGECKPTTFPFGFTSTYAVVAKGSEVRNGTTSVPGPGEAVGYYNFGINSIEDTVCWNITLLNVAGTYRSPAKTATHIHQAARGASGPPRLAFPNPVGDDKKRVSVGCMTGPFTTGLNGTDGKDTGTGFVLKAIEANPAGFFADAHTNLFPLGVVRGQFA